MNTMKRSTIIPLALLAYLGVMSYVGYPIYEEGNYLKYFGIIGCTLLIIVLLHFALKKRERLRREREEDLRKGKGELPSHEDRNKGE